MLLAQIRRQDLVDFDRTLMRSWTKKIKVPQLCPAYEACQL
jgi:hypothetical protein